MQNNFSRYRVRRFAAGALLCQLLLALLPGSNSEAAQANPSGEATPSKEPLVFSKPIEQKCFYFLAAMQELPEVRQVVLSNPDLLKIALAKSHAVAEVSVGKSAADIISSIRWTDVEIKSVSNALQHIVEEHPEAGATLSLRLQQSGMFVREQALAPKDLIAIAWERSAHGINHVLDVYGNGAKPQYPKIDSISFDSTSADWTNQLKTAAAKAVADVPADQDFCFGASLRLALQLLEINGRDEAGRFEPMSLGENNAPLAYLPSINWQKYQYSCILVLGIGPESPDVALSAGGKSNCKIAADGFKAGKAPLILLSGGYVHPNKTKYCEAIEMRRELIQNLGIPAEAVIIDPHARHTTTNLRNAARLIYRYGLPFDKPILITSNASQLATVESAAFATRCQRELGYQPAQIGKRVSPTELEALCNIDSLETDPLSPLDP